MYLAKFFHRAPGDDDRELLLIPGEPMLIGIHMREPEGYEADEFLRDTYGGIGEAIAAMRRHAAALRADGYMETAHTRYTLRNLLPDPQPKPSWQQGIDELMLAALAEPLDAQAKWIAALADTPAAHEPLYLWLAAHHAHAAFPDDDRALGIVQAARDALTARRAAKAPHYAWSIYEADLEGRILELLYRAHLRADDPTAALDAIELACDVSPSSDRLGERAWLICTCFPQRQDEAFDDAYVGARWGGFEDITDRPEYADYLRWREEALPTDRGWRWSGRLKPASDDELLAAETALGTALPPAYRRFLADPGYTNLLIRLPQDSSSLRFYRASELATQREGLFDFITLAEGADDALAYFRERYGISLRDLVPVAAPTHESRCVAIHLGAGDLYGWCYQWDHDDPWELDHATPSFDAALSALTGAVERRDASQLRFLGISV